MRRWLDLPSTAGQLPPVPVEGMLEAALLVLVAEGPRYGYQLWQELRSGDLAAGRVHVGTEVPRAIPLVVTDAQKADDASLTLLMGRLKKGRLVIDECSHQQGALSEGEVAPVAIADGGMEVARSIQVGTARG